MPQSLQCPKCNGIVTVHDRDAGSRVKCPHCENSFIAPPIETPVKDDDEWLRLDDDVVTKPIDTGGKSAEENANTGVDDFLDVDDVVPGAHGSSEFGASAEPDLFGDLPPMEIPPLAPPLKRPATSFGDDELPELGPPVKKPAAAADSIEYQTEFRLNCPVCGSMLYAKASQEGKTITCSDCHSKIVVPPPPKVKKSAPIDIENAQTFAFEVPPKEARREDPFRKSAADLLNQAEQAEREVKAEDFDVPSLAQWARRVFGIFTDLNVMVRWILFSLFGSIPVYIALSVENQFAVLAVIVGGVLFSALLIASGFAILESVANDERTVEEWPSMDPLEWLGRAWTAFAAVGFAGVPALVASQFVFDNSLIIIAVTMLSIYILFPFVLLSMLDMQTITMPFSPEVARSVSKSQESWGGFYFSAGLLFFGLYLLFVGTSGMDPPVAAIVNVTATVGLVFTYFAMIGRLAFAIGQSVNEKPRENDIESERAKQKESKADH